MEFSELIQARKSIRGYQQKPVPREVIEEIIEVAKWAPSSMNTQPWHVHVVTGEPLERIRRGKITEDEFAKIVEVTREMQSLPLYIDATGGITIDTMFIDEGFGSLDEDTLHALLAEVDDLLRRWREDAARCVHWRNVREHQTLGYSPNAPIGVNGRFVDKARVDSSDVLAEIATVAALLDPAEAASQRSLPEPASVGKRQQDQS